MNHKQLSKYFSDAELMGILMDAVYAECLIRKPEAIHKALESFPGGVSEREKDEFIKAEKLRLAVEFAGKAGFDVGVLATNPDTVGDVAGSC